MIDVLIVDDSADVRALFTLMCKNLQVTCRAAASGQMALAMVAQRPAHLIILDVLMPDMDGYTTARKLRESGYAGRILFLSALPVDTVEAQGVDAWAERKPFSKAQLVFYLNRLKEA